MIRPLEVKLSHTVLEQEKVSKKQSSAQAKLFEIRIHEKKIDFLSKRISLLPLQTKNSTISKLIKSKKSIKEVKSELENEISTLSYESLKLNQKKTTLEGLLVQKKREQEVKLDEYKEDIVHEFIPYFIRSEQSYESTQADAISPIDTQRTQIFQHISARGSLDESVGVTSVKQFPELLPQEIITPIKVETSPHGISVDVFHKNLSDKNQRQLQDAIEEILKKNGFKTKKVRIVS